MPNEYHSTDDVPAKDRVDYWKTVIRGLFIDAGFECGKDLSEKFSAVIRNKKSGPIDMFEIDAAAHSVHHTTKPSCTPAILLVLQQEGEGYISQNSRNDVLKPGDFTLLDGSRPFDLLFHNPLKLRVIRIPWQSVHQQLISPSRIAGLSINGSKGIGSVASNFIQSYVSKASELDDAESTSLSHSLIEIVNASALSVLKQNSLDQSNYSAYQVHRIRLFIEENLHDTNLSPSLIAEANGISLRYLSKLFEAEEISISRLLFERRLEKCKKDLSDRVLAGKSITEIAYFWGFKSSSHFSRSFKDRFDMTPREYRASHATYSTNA